MCIRDRDGPNVKLPAGLLIYGSVDGEEWKVFRHVDSVYSEGASSIAQVDETFDKAYKVRYIRITFSVLPHVYCDEIEILGRKNVEGAAALSESTAVNDLYPQAFITPDQFDGVENMIPVSYTHLIRVCIPAFFALHFDDDVLELFKEIGVVLLRDQLDGLQKVKAEDAHQALRIDKVPALAQIDGKRILLHDADELAHVVDRLELDVNFLHKNIRCLRSIILWRWNSAYR